RDGRGRAAAREASQGRGVVRGRRHRRRTHGGGSRACRIRARLAELQRSEAPVEIHFAVPDTWSRQLFLALCRRYGITPYRYLRRRRSTVMLRAPRRFVDEVLGPGFKELDADLRAYLEEVTQRLIREEVFADVSDAPEVAPAALPRR